MKAKNCPFCGSDTEQDEPYIADVHHSEEDGPYQQFFFVRCGQCEAAGPYGETEEEALAAWNNRNDR